MSRIVEQPLKVDFHIHSVYSKYKDKEITKNSTIENLSLLLDKLKENQIDCIAITDHDVFSIEMYNAVKEWERQGILKKVFPGVEFSVGFETDNNDIKQVHVVAIFDDEDSEGIKRLSEVLPVSKEPDYDSGTEEKFFTERKFRDILSDIGLDVILIAHQKGSLTSIKASKKDAKSVGEQHFNEFLNCGYFEAFEFKSPRSGLFNNLYKRKLDEQYNTDVLRFLTGSDCHDWSCYPDHDKDEHVEGFQWTYLKCLPSFRGLKLAATDDSRIRLNDNFFSHVNTLKEIKLSENGEEVSVPLSRGINAIIGDNSVGKSALLHFLTSFSKFDKTNSGLSNSLKKGYDDYFAKVKIKVSPIPKSIKYNFDYQGEIRARFESGNEFSQSFIESHYPEADPPSEKYIDFAKKLLSPIFEKMRLKEKIINEISSLPTITILSEKHNKKNLLVTKLSKDEEIDNRVVAFSKIKASLDKASESILAITFSQHYLNKHEGELLNTITANLAELKKSVESDHLKAKFLQALHDSVKKGIDDFKDELKAYVSADEEKYNSEIQKRDILVDTINLLLSDIGKYKSMPDYIDETIQIEIEERSYGEFKFLKRFKCKAKTIDFNYIQSVIERLLIKEHPPLFPIESLNLTELGKIINEKIIPSKLKNSNPIDILESLAKQQIQEDFGIEKAILKKGTDFTETYSKGLNSSNYFEILGSDDDESTSIYLVDQPEDDISQTAIHDILIPSLKKLSYHRQIILVTHNPQLVVNLDADNVIYISRQKGNGHLVFESGALEYLDKSIDVLAIVAKHLDGGVNAVKERLTRYEKGQVQL